MGKMEISRMPEALSESWPGQFEIFSWIEFVTAIPQAISVITTLKEGNIPNACLQAWTLYSGDNDGYYVVFSVLERTHTYRNILREKEFVVNFPNSNEFRRCMDTIKNNGEDTDEIAASGLTVETSKVVNAPRIRECFLNLECRLGWHKPLHAGSLHHVFAGEVVHVAVSEDTVKTGSDGRYGDEGYIYNIHSPINPATGEEETARVGKIVPMYDM